MTSIVERSSLALRTMRRDNEMIDADEDGTVIGRRFPWVGGE